MYSFQDLVALRVARDFRKAGVSVKSLENVVQFLRDKKRLKNPLAEVRLAVAGGDVLVVGSNCEELMSALEKPGQGVFVFMVNVTKTSAELKKRVQSLRAA